MMHLRITIAIVAVAGTFSGCATVRVYPICFYDKKPDLPIVEKSFVPGLRQSFGEVAAVNPQEVVISPDVRWIIARTTDKQDADLLRVWPRVACIGPGRSTSQVKLQADCIAYVEDFIKVRRYTELGEYQGTSGSRYFNEARDPKRLVYCAADN